MGGGVAAEGQAADDDETTQRGLCGEFKSDTRTIRGMTRADQGHGGRVQEAEGGRPGGADKQRTTGRTERRKSKGAEHASSQPNSPTRELNTENFGVRTIPNVRKWAIGPISDSNLRRMQANGTINQFLFFRI